MTIDCRGCKLSFRLEASEGRTSQRRGWDGRFFSGVHLSLLYRLRNKPTALPLPSDITLILLGLPALGIDVFFGQGSSVTWGKLLEKFPGIYVFNFSRFPVPEGNAWLTSATTRSAGLAPRLFDTDGATGRLFSSKLLVRFPPRDAPPPLWEISTIPRQSYPQPTKAILCRRHGAPSRSHRPPLQTASAIHD